MKLAENPSGPGAYNRVPDPEFVYRLSLSHGIDAVAERWGAFSRTTIFSWISIGRLRATGKRKFVRRSAEEIQAIVDAAFKHGSPTAAARALGLDPAVVVNVLQRAGVRDYPRTDPRESGRRGRLVQSSTPRP